MCARCCYVAAALQSLYAQNLKRELPHAGLVQMGSCEHVDVVNRSNLTCEVVGKGREKLLEDFVEHVLSGITSWQQYILQISKKTAFLFALLALYI